MSMRDFILKVMPSGMAESAEAESKEWQVICGDCGHAISYWDMGGLRYKASSKGKRLLRSCDACKARSWHKVERVR